MGYAAAPRVAFIVYGIQTFFTAIIIKLALQCKERRKLALQCTSKTYLQRLSVIWSSPLSDTNRVQASNQLAMPVLSYLMWSQHWCLTDLRDIDRQARKIVCESGGKHPLGLKATVYLPRALGGRGMRSVEEEYKMTKIKSAIKEARKGF